MALMKWDRSFSVGVNEMDAQHQKWFSIINRLHDAMMTGKGRQMQETILAEMVGYTRTHFANEEALLKTRGYPKLVEHQQKHVVFTQQVQALEAKLLAGSSVLTVDVMDFLKNWLNNHILAVDTQYGDWLRRR
jgi:hemerythrin